MGIVDFNSAAIRLPGTIEIFRTATEMPLECAQEQLAAFTRRRR
jgi:hypothetical protein